MTEVMQQIRKELGSDTVILQSKENKKDGILEQFKNKQIKDVAALDTTPHKHTEKTQETTLAFSNKKPIPQANDQKVLKEIQYLKKLVEKQAVHSKQDLPPLFELTRQYLLKQEMDEQLVDTIMDDLTKDSDVNAITSKEDMKRALE